MSLTEYAENIFKTVQIDLKAVGSTISSSIDTFVDQQLNNSTNTNGAMEVTLETIKEIALGSAFGMCEDMPLKKQELRFWQEWLQLRFYYFGEPSLMGMFKRLGHLLLLTTLHLQGKVIPNT